MDLPLWHGALSELLRWLPLAAHGRDDCTLILELLHSLIDLLAVKATKLGNLACIQRLTSLLHNLQYFILNLHNLNSLQVNQSILLLLVEQLLTDAAYWASPIIWKLVKRCARSNSVIWVTNCWVIGPSARHTCVLIHNLFSFIS